jgi:sodium transport system permease protein
MLQRTLTIWGKELRDTLRDRRTLAVMVLAPVLLMPLFTLLPLYLMGGQMRHGQTASFVVHVQGAAHGPQLIDFLRQAGAEVREVTGEPTATVLADRASIVLVIPPDFEARLAAERPTPIKVVADESNISSSIVSARLRELLGAFGQGVAAERLAARGLDAAIMTPITIESQNVATEQQMGGSFLGMFLPMFLVLFAFLGGMYAAIDVTAGEKERGTLEPLLTAPVGRAELVLGKLLAVFVASFAAVTLSLLSTFLAFQLAPADLFGPQMSFALPLDRILWLIVVALPLTLMLCGLEMIICIFARSFKEAQNYVTPLQLGLMLPAIVVGFVPAPGLPVWAYAVPALGQIVLFRDILAGGALDGGHLALSLASSILYALLAIAAAVRTFRREDVLFRT